MIMGYINSGKHFRLIRNLLRLLFLFLFFFQAEDGIRDDLVTGVQTCALPIYPNSLDFDRDGNYVASFRHMGEITKIDRRTSEIIWRLGGRNNQFAIMNDPLGGFSAQHSVRVLDNGNLLLYDNGLRHSPLESRAVEYRLDTDAKTATMVWQYRRVPPVFTPFLGSVQRYQNGNTLIAFSTANLIVEVDPSGNPLWEGVLNLDGQSNVIIFKALKVPSLYRYERP